MQISWGACSWVSQTPHKTPHPRPRPTPHAPSQLFRRPLEYRAALHLNSLAATSEYPSALRHSSDARSGVHSGNSNSYTLTFRNTKQQQAKLNPAWYYAYGMEEDGATQQGGGATSSGFSSAYTSEGSLQSSPRFSRTNSSNSLQSAISISSDEWSPSSSRASPVSAEAGSSWMGMAASAVGMAAGMKRSRSPSPAKRGSAKKAAQN